jgi:hypothetical protein
MFKFLKVDLIYLLTYFIVTNEVDGLSCLTRSVKCSKVVESISWNFAALGYNTLGGTVIMIQVNAE